MFSTGTHHVQLSISCDRILGKGVFATEEITCGELVAVYHGELISEREAEERESNYEKKNYGSYLYFFEHHGQRKW